MYYDSSLTKKDRIKLVIDMYKEGATRPKIARSTHFNFGTIKKIIDDYERSKADKIRAIDLKHIRFTSHITTSVSRHKT